MDARSTSLPATVESAAAARRPRNGGGGPGGQGPGRWKLVLEVRWQRKIDEVVILSQARSGLSSEPAETPAAPGARQSRRLAARIDAALDEVAAIEDAIARLDDGSYGTCAGCDRPMAAKWLTETPEAQYCPDCSLRLVSWQPPSRRKTEGAPPRSGTPGPAAEAPQTPPKPTRRKPRQGSAAGDGSQALREVARCSSP